MWANNEDSSYEPSIADVLVVRFMLAKMTFKASQDDDPDVLPSEIIDMIMDRAEYWPHSTAEVDYTGNVLDVRAGSPDGENRFLVRSKPLGFFENDLPKQQEPMPVPVKEEHPTDAFQDYIYSRWHASNTLANPCRKIVFTITSHDQGWGGEAGTSGTYNASYTWFDAGLERFDAEGSNPELTKKIEEKRREEAQRQRQRQQRILTFRGGPRRFGRGGRGGMGAIGGMGEVPLMMPETSSAGPSNVIHDQTPVTQPPPPTPAAPQEPEPEDEPKQDKGKAAEKEPEPASEDHPWGMDNLHTVLPEVQPAEGDNDVPKFKFPLLPEVNLLIQCNVTTKRVFQEHRVVWKYTDDVKATDEKALTELQEKGRGRATGDGSFVRDLKLGDVVTVWAKARFAGWTNHVQRVKVEVYWAL